MTPGEARARFGSRIAVVGTTGAGKSTLARDLAGRLGAPCVELDALYWGPDWTPASDAAFRARTAEAVAGDAWVVAGNYGQVRDLVWPRADRLVWLDYSIRTVFPRLVRRTLRRTRRREALWAGNRERFWAQFAWNGLFIWALRTHWRRRREYPALLRRPQHAHLRLTRLRSPAATARWLTGTDGAPSDQSSSSGSAS